MDGIGGELIDVDDVVMQFDQSATEGISQKDTEEMFNRLKQMAKDGIDHYQPMWREANQMYDLYAGRQWSEEDKAVLERQLRPAITFNRIGPVVDSVIGLEINNREMVQIYPRLQGAQKRSELLTGAAMWVREKAHAEGEEADAFLDLTVAGMGWVDTFLTESDKPNTYDIDMSRVDPTEMFVDPTSKKRNCVDARYIGRVRSIPSDAAMELFDLEEDEIGLANADWAQAADEDVGPSVLPERYLFNDAQRGNSGKTKSVTVVELQWWQKEPYWEVYNPVTGGTVHMDDAKFKELKRRYKLIDPNMPLEQMSVRYKRKVYKRAFLGKKILAQPVMPCPYDFTYQCMTGKRDKTKRHWFGIVRAMADPQMWANKWLSQVMHILNSNAKGGIMAPKNAFADWKEVEKRWSDPTFIAWLEDGKSADMVQQRNPPAFPQQLMEMLTFAVSSVRDTTGVSLEMMGMADRDQASSLEYQRRQAGMSVLAQFFNSMRMYRKRQAKTMLYMMQKWISDGRLVRVSIDQGEEQYTPLVIDKDEGVIEYDVVVDEAPSSPNQKEKTWSMLTQMMPMLANAQLPTEVWGEILKASPLPSSLVAKLQQLASKPPDPEAQAQQQKMQDVTLRLMGAQAMQMEGQAAESAADVQKQMAQAAKLNTEAEGQQIENVIKQTAAGQRELGAPNLAGAVPADIGGLPSTPGSMPASAPSPIPAGMDPAQMVEMVRAIAEAVRPQRPSAVRKTRDPHTGETMFTSEG